MLPNVRVNYVTWHLMQLTLIYWPNTFEDVSNMNRRRRITRVYDVGIASNYMHHLPDYAEEHPDAAYILMPRTSCKRQGKHENSLVDQEAMLWDEANKYSLNVCKVMPIEGEPANTYYTDPRGKKELARLSVYYRPQFEAIVEEARKHGAAILAGDRSRFLRYKNYRLKAPNNRQILLEVPTRKEYHRLSILTRGVDLVTVEHPDAEASHTQSEQTKRGLGRGKQTRLRHVKKTPGYCKRRRIAMRKALMEILERPGRRHGYRKITEELNMQFKRKYKKVGYATIRLWIKKLGV